MRDLSHPTLAAIYAVESDAVELCLLTITHESLDAGIRLVNNSHDDIVSRGHTFRAHAFEPPTPVDQEGGVPRVEMVVDGVDQTLIAELRAIQTPLTLLFEFVFAATPDDPHVVWRFGAREASYTRSTIRLVLEYEPVREEPFPHGRFTPIPFPGLFNAVRRT